MSAQSSGSKLARAAVYLAAAWLVLWAGMKLLYGNPASLPPAVRDLSPFSADLTFRLAIAIELSIFFLAITKPRIGWLPLATLYAFFVALLVPMVAAGLDSCGCGGGAVKMHPTLMIVVDGLLLLALLVARPWKRIEGGGLPAWLLVVGLALSWAGPWLLIRSTSADAGPIVVDATTGEVRDSKGAAVRYVELEPTRWKGLAVDQIADLQPLIPVELLPIDGDIVFWRQGCDVCAAHLRELAAKNDGSRQYLLVQIRDDLENSRAVDLMPEGGNVATHAFPENAQFILTTPCEVLVTGGVVTGVREEKDLHPH